jgi:predicted ATPase
MAGMYSERLIVRNFGPITNLDIEIRPLTLFIGTQGSGKSTVAKLLTICRNREWWLSIWENTNPEEIARPFTDYAINAYFSEDSYICYIQDGHQVTYENGVFSFHSDTWELDELKQFIQNSTKNDKKDTLYVPADRNLIGSLSTSLASIMANRIPLPTPLLEYMSLFEMATKDFPRYEIPFFGVTYVKKDNRNMIELKGTGKTLLLNASSSGLQSAIPMLMVIDSELQNNGFRSYVIEEPEQNLFPENQREVLSFVTSRMSRGDNRQFIMTTHSPYMLSCLNVLMLAYKLQHEEDTKEESGKIVNPEFAINPNDVAAYGLTPDDEDGVFCRSLISEKTGMVSVNELDTVSIYIGEEFDRLYDLFIKQRKNKQ